MSPLSIKIYIFKVSSLSIKPYILYIYTMKNRQSTPDFQSAKTRAQFFVDHSREMTYREIAQTFGWIKQKSDEKSIQRGVQRVKNLKKSLEKKLGIDLQKRDDLYAVDSSEIVIPPTLKTKQLKNTRESVVSSSSRQGVPKEGYDRHTMIIRNDYYKKIKEKAQKEGKTVRKVMDEVFSSYFG